jgi:moderate conductance mechanosensitive channel
MTFCVHALQWGGCGHWRVCSRWFSVYLAVAPFNFFVVWLVERLGFGHEAVFGAATLLGLVITLYKIEMFWTTRRPIARAILAATGGEPGPVRQAVAASWHWFFIALSLGIFFGSGIELALGKGAWVARAAAATQGIVVVLAVVGQASHNLILRLCPGDAADFRLTLRRARFRRALSGLVDAFVWILGAAWLGETWGLDLIDPAPGSIERMFVRPALEAAATVVAAWILWTALSAVIDEKMPPPAKPGDEDEVPGSASRLDTLLPLLRNTLLIGLAVVAIIVALTTLGLDIGPLLAGLGVVGIAIGFGAQGLVRDVISGIFFLMEDTFRVGEYIDTGRLRGTVEGMSLRSVRLRHQNGQVHTIPFGQVLSVTNYSRDWPAVVWHMAKILECGAAAVAVRTAPDCMMAELHEDSFDVFPLREDYHCTPQSVASHTLYENADPFELKEPSGPLRTDKARYEAISDRAVRVSGSEFMRDPEYTIKLEGVRRVGYSTILMGGVRDPGCKRMGIRRTLD